MSAQVKNWYASKIDWWILPLLCLPPIAAIFVCGAAWIDGSPTELSISLVVALFVAMLYLGVIFPMRYGIDGAHLIVRCGLLRQRVPLSEITRVVPTRNPLSSPALSLDRLRIEFGVGFFKAIMISPARRSQFLEELAAATQLKPDQRGGLG